MNPYKIHCYYIMVEYLLIYSSISKYDVRMCTIKQYFVDLSTKNE